LSPNTGSGEPLGVKRAIAKRLSKPAAGFADSPATTILPSAATAIAYT
jgi:hypothetical protein